MCVVRTVHILWTIVRNRCAQANRCLPFGNRRWAYASFSPHALTICASTFRALHGMKACDFNHLAV